MYDKLENFIQIFLSCDLMAENSHPKLNR